MVGRTSSAARAVVAGVRLTPSRVVRISLRSPLRFLYIFLDKGSPSLTRSVTRDLVSDPGPVGSAPTGDMTPARILAACKSWVISCLGCVPWGKAKGRISGVNPGPIGIVSPTGTKPVSVGV